MIRKSAKAAEPSRIDYLSSPFSSPPIYSSPKNRNKEAEQFVRRDKGSRLSEKADTLEACQSSYQKSFEKKSFERSRLANQKP